MQHFETLILGAGPAGLQMGFFFERAGREYRILEAESIPGSFFAEHPRHRTLLSINKRFNYYDEAEFNLRHDWNSLLSDDEALLFPRYSEELYPHADDLVRYLKDYAERLQLQIEYGCRIVRIRRNEEGRFLLDDQSGGLWSCERLLLATGAVTPRAPEEIEGIELAEGYCDHPLDPRDYENQRVAIIGRGNSAFEVANHLAGHAAIVQLLVGVPIKHAWQTHYPGDLRAINNTILDMYQLKSLHAAVGFVPRAIRCNDDGTLTVTMEEDYPHWETPGTGTTTMVFDRIIHCTGWNYVMPDLFEENCRPEVDERAKFPLLSTSWESSVPNLFFLGAAMQARDRRSASAFIHGFRYNVRTLFHLLEERHHGVPLPQRDFSYQESSDLDRLAQMLIDRLSTTSGLFQLFGFFCDVLVFDPEGGGSLYAELPVEHVLERSDFKSREVLILITLEYGFHKYPKGVATLDFIHPADASRPQCSAYLHPVLRRYERGELVDEAHLGESLVVRYDIYDYAENDTSTHKNAIKNFLNQQKKVTDEVFSEEVYNPNAEVFRPWPEEKVEAVERKKERENEAECDFVTWP